MSGEPIPRIQTDRLVLRAIEPGDVDVYHERIFADPEVMRFLPGGGPMPRDRLDGVVERSLGHWTAHGYGVWIVCDRESDDLIGQCGLRFLDDLGETEVLYALGRPWWGRGMATEAAWTAVRFGFERGGLERIVAFAVPENLGSIRVMEKIGMTRRGEIDVFGLHCVRYAIEHEGFPPDPR